MDVSVIIVNYNTMQLTKNCIDSIVERTKGVTYEIILIDNASTDGSMEFFAKEKGIRFFPQSENLGFGKANNIGIQFAQGKYLFFLNSDTYLCNNAIKLFFDYYENSVGKNIGAVGCLLKGADLRLTHSFADFPTIGKALLGRLINPIYRMFGYKYNTLDNVSLIQKYPFKVNYVTGADIFIKKSLLDRFGAFDPDFFMYYEETEMQWRLAKAGYQSYILTTPEIVHLEGGSMFKSTKRNVKKMMVVQKSEFIYFKKTTFCLYYFLFRICFFLVRLPFLCFSSLTTKEKKNYFRLLVSHV